MQKRVRTSPGLVQVTAQLIPRVDYSDSTLISPIGLLLLLLTFGPCILNKLVSLVKERINTVQLIVLRSQYIILETLSENP